MRALLRGRGGWVNNTLFVDFAFPSKIGPEYWCLSMLFDEVVRMQGRIFDFRNRPSLSRRQDGIGWPPPCRIRKGQGQEKGKKGTTAGLSHPPGRVSWVRGWVLACVGKWILSVVVASQGRVAGANVPNDDERNDHTANACVGAREERRNAGTQERRNE